MTKKELIEYLSNYDDDTRILTWREHYMRDACYRNRRFRSEYDYEIEDDIFFEDKDGEVCVVIG